MFKLVCAIGVGALIGLGIGDVIRWWNDMRGNLRAARPPRTMLCRAGGVPAFSCN